MANGEIPESLRRSGPVATRRAVAKIHAELDPLGEEIDRQTIVMDTDAVGEIAPPPPRPTAASPLTLPNRIRALEEIFGNLLRRVDATERQLARLDGEPDAATRSWLQAQDTSLRRLIGIERRLTALERTGEGEDTPPENGDESASNGAGEGA